MQFQSTLPRRERHLIRAIVARFTLISIHAPAKGATIRGFRLLTRTVKISIHAPAKGATDASAFVDDEQQFQSTLPRRERLPFIRCKIAVFAISIHAPAKGATQIKFTQVRSLIFQSTLPRRERQHLLTSFRLQYGYFYFISTIKYSSCFKKIN